MIKEKKVKKKSQKTINREFDNMWIYKVKTRDKWTCQVCGKKVEKHNCQAHHIIPKSIAKHRWDIHNGITLCLQHHKFGRYAAHSNAVWFTYWLKTNKPEQFKHVINSLMKLSVK